MVLESYKNPKNKRQRQCIILVIHSHWVRKKIKAETLTKLHNKECYDNEVIVSMFFFLFCKLPNFLLKMFVELD